MHRWSIAVAAGLLAAASCGASRPEAGPEPSSSATAGPSPSATTGGTAAGTPVSSGSTGTAGGTGAPGRWDTPCGEVSGAAPAAGLAYDGVSDRFGPLGSAPLLDVTLPTVTPTAPDVDGQVQAHAAPVNGGAVVAVTAGRGDPDDASVVAVVERGGGRRWVRCLAGTVLDVWVAAPRLQPTTALVALFPPGGAPTAQWSLLALDTGETVPGFSEAAAGAGLDPAILAEANVTAVSAASALIMHSGDDGGGRLAVDTVARYDLVAGTVTVIPPPPTGFGDAELTLGPGDDVVLSAAGDAGVTAVFHGGAWRTDGASLLAARPVRVSFAAIGGHGGADPRPLEAVDATGHVLWRNAEMTDPSMEGTRTITDGAVTVANVCTDAASGLCHRFEVVGVDTATGAVRWRLPGLRSVAAAADGWVLIADGGLLDDDSGTAPTGWELLDDRTGAAAPDQRWSGADRFAQGCCGDIERWVDQVGGVVIAAAPGHLRFWYPAATDGTVATVSLL